MNWLTSFAVTNEQCNKDFFGIPAWHNRLNKTADCGVQFKSLTDTYAVLAGVIEIALRLSAFIAIGFVMYAGFLFITGQGNPERTTAARNTLVNALIGLAITLLATTIVGFVAGKF